MGFFDKLFGGKAASETKFSGQKMTVMLPIDGKVIPLEQLPDETFASAILGPGCGVEPTGDTVYAPFDGTVTQVPESLHAVGMMSDDGTVSVNTAPTITSSTANGSNLGTKTAGFNFQYTVNDVDGDTVTVKEYLDNVLKRTYTATLGQVNTFQAVTAANWQKILNGSHTLKVVASDGKADSAAYTVTFAKKVTKATVTLAAPLAADDAISVMVMNIVGTLPADAVMEVLVTNNAKDTTPVWEDATADVKNGANHVFTNKTAANGFAFNFKLSVERGASDTGGYISNIGGAFE